MSAPMAAPGRVVLFTHSLVSDWNHGNAHFLRGIVAELQRRGARVTVYEPIDSWSRANLLADHGAHAVLAFHDAYPTLTSVYYDPERLEIDQWLHEVDLVLVHEWSSPALVAAIGAHRVAGGQYTLFFHDTHHRLVSDPDAMAAYDLDGYDGVLAFGEVLRERYEALGWGARAFTWHEAADVTRFTPHPEIARVHDLVWIGNWGDGEREAELHEFLLLPVRRLGLQAVVHGVRYPADARRAVEASGARFGGWLPNHRVPLVFAAARTTVHVPRRFYREVLPGIPTIRMFEALACGVPLVSAPWRECEGLFTAGRDYLVAETGAEMTRQLATLLADPAQAAEIARHGMETVRARHTCAHRVTELLAIAASLHGNAACLS